MSATITTGKSAIKLYNFVLKLSFQFPYRFIFIFVFVNRKNTASTTWTNELCHFYFANIFGFCCIFHRHNQKWSSHISGTKFCHLTLIVLPHYRVKCEQVQFVKTRSVAQFSCNDVAVLRYWIWLIRIAILIQFLRDDISLVPFKCVHCDLLKLRTVHLHIARVRETVKMLRRDFIPLNLWPPNSPDLNPVDYYT